MVNLMWAHKKNKQTRKENKGLTSTKEKENARVT